MKDLERLCAELEAGWFSTEDASLVDKLAAANPELADDLYDHFALMIESQLDSSAADRTGSANKSAEWLKAEGFQVVRDTVASQAANTTPLPPDPQPEPPNDQANVLPFTKLSRLRTGRSGDELASEIGLPNKFLSVVMRAPPEERGSIPREIARRVVPFGIHEEEAMESFNVPLRLAARKRGESKSLTLREQLQLLEMSPEELEYWTKLIDTQE